MMVDVDLRYVMRSVPAPELGEDVGRYVHILQWRKKRLVTYAGIARNGTFEEWTDWQDVRTEEE